MSVYLDAVVEGCVIEILQYVITDLIKIFYVLSQQPISK